jgi:hypothetical protein
MSLAIKPKYAQVVRVAGDKTPEGREYSLVVRGGKKGTGKVYGQVAFLPWVPVSAERAERAAKHIAEQHGLTLVENYLCL